MQEGQLLESKEVSSHFDVLQRLTEIREAKGYSVYRLAKLSGIPQSTIATWYQKALYPPIDKIERLCEAMDISLSTFFNVDDFEYKVNRDEAELLKGFALLSTQEQDIIRSVMQQFLLLHKQNA